MDKVGKVAIHLDTFEEKWEFVLKVRWGGWLLNLKGAHS